MAARLASAASQLESLGDSVSGANSEGFAELGKQVSTWLLEELGRPVPDAEVLISAMKVVRQFSHLFASSLAGVTVPAVAGLTSLLLGGVQAGRIVLMPKEEERRPFTEAAEKASVELLECTLGAVLTLCNFLPQAQGEVRADLINSASETHKSTLAFAKAALNSKSQLAPRLWKNIGEQLHCVTVQPALESVLFDVPEAVAYLFEYNTSQLKAALSSWDQAVTDPLADTQVRDKRLSAPIRHGLLTVLRITASCPASVASEPCALELSSFIVLVTSLVSSTASPLPASARNVLTKAVAEAMLAVLTMLLESESVPDTSKCFLVRALCESEFTLGASSRTGAVAFYRACMERDDLRRLLPLGRLTSFCTLLSHSSKYSLVLKEELAQQLPQLSKLVEQSYPSLLTPSETLSETPNPYEQLLRSLATFAVVTEASGSSEARQSVDQFLLQGAISSHPLRQQLAHDLWELEFQLAEPSLQDAHLTLLLTVLSGLVVAETAQQQNGTCPDAVPSNQHLASAVSSVARLVNQLLTGSSSEQVASVYKRYIGPLKKSLSEARVCATLLRNGFPVVRLSGAFQKELAGALLNSTVKAAEGEVSRVEKGAVSFAGDLLLESLLRIMEAIVQGLSFERLGSHASARSAGQLALRIFASQTGTQNGTENGTAALQYEPALRLLIAAQQHVPPEQLWALLPSLLAFSKSAAQSGSAVPPSLKPAAADFLATLSSVPMPDSGPELQALVELYHVLLRENHWALAHLALVSFSHFAATSPYVDLWRLVPTDAVAGRFEGNLAGDSLSDSGQELDGFMRSLQAFLERSVGNGFSLLGQDELCALEGDGRVLEERAGEKLVVQSVSVSDIDLNEAVVEEVQGNGFGEENGFAGPESAAGVPEELQDACDDVERSVTALRNELKRAKSRLTSDERGLLRKKLGSLSQKLASLTDQLCPD